MSNSSSFYSFTEEDIRSFIRETSNPYELFWLFLFSFIFILILAGASFWLLNFNSLERLQNTPIVSDVSPIIPVVSKYVLKTPVPISDLPNNSAIYPDLNISAPINWDVPFQENVILHSLESGVVQIAGTAHPGQIGSVIIFGHSSNYPWVKGSFNSVFAPLQKAQLGQKITLVYQKIAYTYQIDKIYVVNPSQISVLEASSFSSLRLITCTPIGTSLRRLVVEAKQISPDPTQNTTFQSVNFLGSIPSVQ